MAGVEENEQHEPDPVSDPEPGHDPEGPSTSPSPSRTERRWLVAQATIDVVGAIAMALMHHEDPTQWVAVLVSICRAAIDLWSGLR